MPFFNMYFAYHVKDTEGLDDYAASIVGKQLTPYLAHYQ
jgi:hypothetical protein